MRPMTWRRPRETALSWFRSDIVTTIKCPQCRTETTLEGNPFRPFCCERCKLIDLGTWATEGYRVPGEKAPSPDDEEDPTA